MIESCLFVKKVYLAGPLLQLGSNADEEPLEAAHFFLPFCAEAAGIGVATLTFLMELRPCSHK